MHTYNNSAAFCCATAITVAAHFGQPLAHSIEPNAAPQLALRVHARPLEIDGPVDWSEARKFDYVVGQVNTQCQINLSYELAFGEANGWEPLLDAEIDARLMLQIARQTRYNDAMDLQFDWAQQGLSLEAVLLFLRFLAARALSREMHDDLVTSLTQLQARRLRDDLIQRLQIPSIRKTVTSVSRQIARTSEYSQEESESLVRRTSDRKQFWQMIDMGWPELERQMPARYGDGLRNMP